jgi:uncharacterized membrane protein
MKEKNSNGDKGDSENEAAKILVYISLLFVCFIFLVAGWTLASEYLKIKGRYYGDMGWQTWILVYPLGAFLYLVGVVGLLLRRRFGYYLGIFLVLLNALFAFISVSAVPATGAFGLVLALISLAIILTSKKYLKPMTKTDKTILLILIALLPLWFVVNWWGSSQPDVEELQKIVTKEAIEKNDVRICNKLVIGKDYCIMDFARNKKDPKPCELVSSEFNRDICYLDIANSIGDPELCKLIKNDYNRGMCNG